MMLPQLEDGESGSQLVTENNSRQLDVDKGQRSFSEFITIQ